VFNPTGPPLKVLTRHSRIILSEIPIPNSSISRSDKEVSTTSLSRSAL
jgi:hypothetical protein